jgi:hypothetical protein
VTTLPRTRERVVREGWAPAAGVEAEPRVTQSGRMAEQLGELITRGAVAGLTAGIGFLLANMAYATTEGKPAEAPLMDISTIFHGASKPAGMKPTVDMVTTGLVTHVGLSILFGISFALVVVAAARVLRNPLALAVGGVLYGLALYVVNFQIFGNTLFPWFTNPAGPDQGFEVGIHAAFGLMLVPFFLGAWRLARRPDPQTY